MSQERIEILRARIEYEDNAQESQNAFDALSSSINRNLSEIGTFETEVSDFSSAMTLAFEKAKRPPSEFFSLVNVGLDEMRKSGVEGLTGLSAIGLGLKGIAERVPAFRGLVDVFDRVSTTGNIVGKIFGAIRQNAQGLEGDFRRVARVASDTGEQFFAQSKATQELFKEEIASQRIRIAELRRYAAQLVKAGAPAEDLRKVQESLANAQDRLNVMVRGAAPQLARMSSFAGSARTAMRRLFNAIEAGSRDAPGRLEDARRATRLWTQELERLKAMGFDVSDSLKTTQKEFSTQLGIASRKLKRQNKEVESLDKTTKEYNKTASGTVAVTDRQSTSFTRVNSTTRIFMSSLSRISPAFSRISSTVTMFTRSFQQQMQVVGNAAATAGAKINASMMIAKGAIIALGIAAVGFIKKTGLIAAEVTTLEVTMRQVARNLAVKAGADLEKFTEFVVATGESLTGITTRERLKAVTSFLRGVPQLLPRMKELSEAAKSFGVTVADMASSEVFGRFNEYIQSGNTALLKRLNIVTTADQMHKKYAATLGKSVKDLTAQEKITARFEGILSEVALTTGVYEKAMATAGKQLSSMKRLLEEAALTLGKRFEPILAKVIFGVNQFLEWFAGLPPVVHDVIAVAIQFVAAAGGIVAIITALGPALRIVIPLVKALGLSFKTAFPWLLAISAAIGAIMLAVKMLRRAWDQNFGGIQEAVSMFVNTIKTEFAPIAADLQFWFRSIMQAAATLVRLLTQFLGPAFTWLASQIADSTTVIGQAFTILKDIVNGFGRAVWKVLMGINALLRGDVLEGVDFLENAFLDLATTIALIVKNTIGKAATWGWNLIVSFANGIMRAASQVIAKAMTWVGEMIGKFIRPGSPPEEGPLRFIARWGRGIMETFLRGFQLADFGLLREAMAPVQQALEAAVQAGTLAEKKLVPMLKNVRESIAMLLSDLRQTGEINEEVMQDITDTLGEGSEDITKFIRLMLEHQKALAALEETRARVEEARAAGFVPEELEKELDQREKAAEAAEEALNWQKEFLAAMNETVDMQLRHLSILDKLADTMEKVAGALGGIGKDGAAAIETPFELIFPEVPEGGLDLGLDRLRLGEVSEDFEEMRKKIQGMVTAVKEWIKLPFREKLAKFGEWISRSGQAVLDWLEDVTGIDFQPLVDAIAKLDFKAISDWIADITGFDPLQWAMDTFGKAWDWIVEKTQWLYDELVGESIIPDMMDEIEEQFGRIDPGKWISDKWEQIKKWWAGLAAFMAPIVSLIMQPFALLGTIIGNFVKGIIDNAPAILEELSGLGEAFGELGIALKDLWVALQPILAVLGVALYFVLTVVSAALNGVVLAVGELVTTFTNALPGIIRVITGIVNFVTALVNIITAQILIMTGRSEEGFALLEAAFGNINEAFKNILSGILETVAKLAAGILAAIIGFALKFTEKIVVWVTGILEELGILEEGATERIQNWFDAVFIAFDNFKTTVGEKIDEAIAIFQGLMDQVDTIWKAMFAEDGFIVTMVETAVDAVVDFITGLWKDLVGESIFTDIKEGIAEIWDEIFNPETGLIVTWVQDSIDALFEKATQFWEAGKSFVANFIGGLKAQWKEAKKTAGAVIDWFADQLPRSEPKDPRSPLRDLDKSGAAIIKNLVAGMRDVDVSGMVNAQLAGMIAGVNATSSTINNATSYKFFDGAFRGAFPNVTRERDAEGFMNILNDSIDRGRAMSQIGAPV